MSASKQAKATSRRTSERPPAHSLKTLLAGPATLTPNESALPEASERFFPLQARSSPAVAFHPVKQRED